MRNEYYCKNCNILFEEEGKEPNLNKRHSCGGSAKLIRRTAVKEKESENS